MASPQRKTQPARLGKLLIFDTHPIQYRSPLFRKISALHTDSKVFLFDEKPEDSIWWFKERHQSPPEKWDLPLTEGFPCEIIGARELGWSGFSRKVGALLAEERPSAVLMFGYYLWENWAVWRQCRKHGVPLIFIGDTHSLGTSWARRLVKQTLVRLFFRGIARFVSVGAKNESYYRALGVPPEKIVGGKYSVDETFFFLEPAKASATRRRWREMHSIPEGASVLLFVARLTEVKRPRDVIELHRRLADRSGLHTVIIGKGQLENELRDLAEGLPRLHFLGFRGQAEVRDAYYGADLLLLASTSETWGLVVNESFLAGCPAVVTNTCGCAGELVVPGETGAIYPMGDVEKAAAAVEQILGEPSARERLGKNAREKSLAEYSTSSFAEKILFAASDCAASK